MITPAAGPDLNPDCYFVCITASWIPSLPGLRRHGPCCHPANHDPFQTLS